MKEVVVLLSGLLAIASLCTVEEFSCKSGECVSAQVICDFRKDCSDGSDEEFCGSCNFENHTCGWNDTSDDSYSWRWQLANITLVPGQDHTTGSQWGHVMHVDGKQAGFISKATLEHAVGNQAALGCQISFWYHIHDNESSSSSALLKLTMIRDTTEKTLSEISMSHTDGWEKSTAFIGNQPGGYKLQFLFSPSILGVKDVMLDDIDFEYCTDGDVPAGSDQLSCDFEINTCSWYYDYSPNLLWKRSDGGFNEGPAGSGYYMLISTKFSPDVSSAPRLISFPQPVSGVMCVSFWYHIFGNSIGSLKFITKRSGEEETVVWMRSGTQGNKWRFADLTFNSDKPIQFIIEAVVGGHQGSIAIDDIKVTSGENGSCPAERECTFQGSLCGLLPQPSADFTWSRITGATKPSNSSGPSTDHTLGTQQGYYLSAQLGLHPEGSKGAMKTALMQPTPPEGECLMFWYYMEGSGGGELNVYMETSDSSLPSERLWTKRGDQGKHWRHGRVTLLSPNIPYQVVFEAVVGDEPWRDIALDDLTVLNGACPPPGFCDFEMDLCSWVNSPPAESGVEWDWLSGDSEGRFVPQRDHTTNSALGHFVFLFASNDREETARLESETMEAVDQACLEIWHYAEGWGMTQPSSIILNVFVNEAAGLRPVWSVKRFTNSSWIRDRVDYNATGLHQIVLQATCPEGKEESFALDDIHIIRDMSCADITPTPTPNPTTTPTTAPASAMDCTFEQGLCSWVQEVSDDSNWTLSNGLEVEQPLDGPLYDHTVGNKQGFFLLLHGPGSKDGERAVISAPLIDMTAQFCVGFWYHMLGPSVSSLDLLVQTESSEVLVWTHRGSQNPEWINAQVTINTSDITKIMFSGHRDTTSKGFIAIDDITVREGACINHEMCGFDSSLCGFENDVGHKGQWGRTKGTQSQVDHTYGTENGFYMMVMPSDSTQNEVAQLLTPEFPSAAELCVRFWYWLPAGPSNSLSVHVMRSGETEDALWQRSGAPSSGWEVAEVTVASPAKFYVVFKAFHVPGADSTVKLDDVSVRDGACSPSGSCDFESGSCNWINTHKEGGHDWVLANGDFQGPPTDHTTQTPEGRFLLSSALHQNHRSVSQVVSEWIHLKDASSCLTLWYQMSSSDTGTLKVSMRSGPSEETLVFNSSSSGRSWTRFSQNIESNKPFQLLIDAEVDSRGFVAVDDITVTPGLCQVNETTLEFIGCSFESGTCGWKDISDGQVQWTRGRNATGNTGPSVDNTLGSDLGWYMAVELDRGTQMTPASIQSPTMKQASSTCTLHFYYNMFGEDLEELSVLLMEGSRRTALWSLSGNHGDSWHHGEVKVGRTPQDFTILLEASRDFTKPGHVAIDDISFTNCTLPEPQPQCPEGLFKCNNSACVEHNQRCDFSDDCGDWSDENDCEKLGFEERCSFEQGLCSWAGSDVDTPEAEWIRLNGEDAWPEYGPPRDHTQNSAAGHYVIPETHLTERQASEILSRTLLPSSKCTVRFFYFSLDDAAAKLTAQFRTQKSGSADSVLWLRDDSQSYSWQRAEVTFSSSVNSKIVFRYEKAEHPRGLVALDDISFSTECLFDPDNTKLPDTSPTSAPPTPSHPPTTPASTSPAPPNPCQDDEFFCWRSAGEVCISATLKCDYRLDCENGEDEDGCGPCTFERDQCKWADTGTGQSRWQRQKASNNTEPPTDHTTDTGSYMRVNFSQGSTQSEARLKSPPLPPSPSYCQIKFHFHISAESAGSLRVLMQQAEGSEAILWSRSHNTGSHWTSEQLPLGLHQQPYTVWFSAVKGNVAVDDVSFLNCEKSYKPPALSTSSCSFEEGLCGWVQGAEDELDWLSGSGPTGTPNTGPVGDHTTGKGKYIYIKSAKPSVRGNKAELKSLLLPSAGEKGYCFKFWFHMFGATVGSLRMLLQTAEPMHKTTVWQKSGNQGDEWQLVRIHVTLQDVHQVILEATVGGGAGDIAIDDIALISGPCPASDVCDFEEGSCNWQQQTSDDFDWIRQSGPTFNPNTGPDSDHTTNTPTGHYYLLPSSKTDGAGQTAKMSSPLYPESKGACVQLWYHMYGADMGSLNIYQQSEDGKQALIFSQTGDQGRLWRFAQASLLPRVQPYRVVVEGVKSGPTLEGDMAFDDVHLSDAQCPSHGHCDFENNICGWTNLGSEVDQGDWLRGQGASPNPNTGPSVDHTTNSTHGYYLYVDSSVGDWGDMSFLISDVFQPSTRGHCLSFWYHMYGSHVGTLRVYINDRNMHTGGNEEGSLKWIETGNKGDKWIEARVTIKHEEAFWFVFVYQRGMNTGGDVALDDIVILPGGCYPDPSINPSGTNNDASVGLAVGLTVLAGVIICIFLFMLNRKWKTINRGTIMDESSNHTSALDDFESKTDGAQHESDFSFFNNLYDPSQNTADSTVVTSDA